MYHDVTAQRTDPDLRHDRRDLLELASDRGGEAGGLAYPAAEHDQSRVHDGHHAAQHPGHQLGFPGHDGGSALVPSRGRLEHPAGGHLPTHARAPRWAIRAEDGRGPQTALRDVVAGHFGMAEVRDVAVAIHLGKISEDDLQSLAPPLMATAAQGDQVARDLVSRLAGEIVTMAGTVIQRLGLTSQAVPVVLGGGVLTARDPQLLSWIAERLADQARGAQVSVVQVPPIAGAALLGLDQAGAAPAAEHRLRAAYLPPSSADPGA